MPQAIVDPSELRRFAGQLKHFNEELSNQMGALHGQLVGLNQSWRDKEHDKFVEEFEQTMKAVARFVEASNQHIPFLLRKSERVEEYLQQREDDIMAQTANVHSIEAIKHFRASLIRFIDESRGALASVDVQINRATEWLLHDRPMYWRAEIKRRQQDLSDARGALHKKRLQASGNNAPHDSEEKENLRLAQRRLDEAEQTLERVKKWAPVLQNAINEYFGRSRPLGDLLSGDLQRAIESLDRMTAALDAYIAMAPPSTPRRDPIDRAAAAAPAGGKTATAAVGEPAEAAPQEVRAEATGSQHEDGQPEVAAVDDLTQARPSA